MCGGYCVCCGGYRVCCRGSREWVGVDVSGVGFM